MTGHGEGVAFAQRVAVLGPRAKPALSPRGSKREPCAGPRAQDGGGDAVTHSFTVQTLPEPLLPAWCCTTQHNGKNNGVCVCVCMYMCVCAPHRARHTLRIIGKNNGVHKRRQGLVSTSVSTSFYAGELGLTGTEMVLHTPLAPRLRLWLQGCMVV